jgi:hypothetical protein
MTEDTPRAALWELHILPMFRLVDRDHMLLLSGQRGLDLFDYQQVVDRCRTGVFQSWIRDHMPPPNTGGPWPPEWIALFDRWVSEGYRRLAGAEASYTAKDNGGTVMLIASGEKPSEDDEVWFERLSPADAPREYALVREAIGSPGGDTGEFTVRERFKRVAGVNVVVVHDAGGRHEVPIV